MGFVVASLTSGISIITGFIVLVMVAIYSGLMAKRSKAGNMLVEHYEGLKLYIDKAEKDRIAAQDSVAAPLSARGAGPVRDVKFFEKLLPFAVAMGLEKTWAKAFEDIYVQPPACDSVDWRTVNAVGFLTKIGT